MNYPCPLQCGDTVGLIAPSSPVTSENLAKSIDVITSLGYHVCVGESCYASLHGYLAGSDCLRANDINSMFANPCIKAIFCLRGGYGSTRIMKMINYQMIKKHPKIFVGYSDITSFHLAFQTLCHLVTFHGPMVSSNMINDFDAYTEESFLRAVCMQNCLSFQNPPHNPYHIISPGYAKGIIIGGNLSLVIASIGTFYQPDFHSKILFLEDVGETVPRCDRMMSHLCNTGILDQVNGVLLGNFKDCTNPYDTNYTIYDFFRDFFKDYKKPVIYGIQSDHSKPMGTIPLGTCCTVNTDTEEICMYS